MSPARTWIAATDGRVCPHVVPVQSTGLLLKPFRFHVSAATSERGCRTPCTQVLACQARGMHQPFCLAICPPACLRAPQHHRRPALQLWLPATVSHGAQSVTQFPHHPARVPATAAQAARPVTGEAQPSPPACFLLRVMSWYRPTNSWQAGHACSTCQLRIIAGVWTSC